MRKTPPSSLVSARSGVVLATWFAMLTLGGCGSDGSGDVQDVQGPFVSPMLDTERESSASVGPEGGTVTATGADGTEYALSIPADALLEETEISLPPIVSIDDLPMSGGFVTR